MVSSARPANPTRTFSSVTVSFSLESAHSVCGIARAASAMMSVPRVCLPPPVLTPVARSGVLCGTGGSRRMVAGIASISGSSWVTSSRIPSARMMPMGVPRGRRQSGGVSSLDSPGRRAREFLRQALPLDAGVQHEQGPAQQLPQLIRHDPRRGPPTCATRGAHVRHCHQVRSIQMC